MDAGDLKCQTPDVTITRLGSVTVWVTDELTGTITGGGSVKNTGGPTKNT